MFILNVYIKYLYRRRRKNTLSNLSSINFFNCLEQEREETIQINSLFCILLSQAFLLYAHLNQFILFTKTKGRKKQEIPFDLVCVDPVPRCRHRVSFHFI
eukprot:GHVP01053906.1.p1 GENE.GHVP01053906.1~~GHVP01053906.1.p1  ORF type:complete len:100 (+),score=7.77 GHVP01053906.1:88-387(+)